MAAGTYRLALIASVGVLTCAQTSGTNSSLAPRITARELQARQEPSFVPAHIGQRVSVHGIVATKAINFGEYAHLPVRGDDTKGVLLERPRGGLDEFLPGDVVEATGIVSHRAGAPVLVLDGIVKKGHHEPPEPLGVGITDLSRFENIGSYITVDAYAVILGRNAGGDVLVVGDGGSSLSVFYPRFTKREGIREYKPGDKLRITGIASQYCPVAPFDHGYQLLVDDPAQIILVARGWFLPPNVVIYIGLALIFASAIWWIRERRMASQRRVMRNLMSLSEEVLASNSVSEISRKVQSVLPGVLQASKVDLFLHTRTRNTLDRITNELSPDSASIPVDQPEGAFGSAVSLCFRNRTLLNVPDFRKSPIMDRRHDAGLPASAVFVPMFAQGEVLGVMAVHYRVHLYETRHQHAALQHVGNQIAASLRLQEQHSIREQLLRTEKMAAAGQLISGVAHDFGLLCRPSGRSPAECKALGTAARKPASRPRPIEACRLSIICLSFAKMEQSEAQAVNLHQLVSGVMEAGNRNGNERESS